MTLTEFAHLPPGVVLLVAVMVWPAVWAAAGIATALGSDVARAGRRRHSTETNTQPDSTFTS